MRQLRRSLVCAALLLATGCQSNSEPVDSAFGTGAGSPVHQDGGAGLAEDDDEHGTDREPQALLPIMVRMSADVTGLMQALWREDLAALSERAQHLAGHAPISVDELARIRSVLGPDMAAFEEADETVHEAAVRMSRAADTGDIDQLLDELATVQRGCVACHTRFRARLSTTGR